MEKIRRIIFSAEFCGGFFLSRWVYCGKVLRKKFLEGVALLESNGEIVKAGFGRGVVDFYFFTEKFRAPEGECSSRKFSRRNYIKYLKGKEWKTKRRVFLDKVGERCFLCGGSENIDVHHLTYDNIFREKESDLIPVCRTCHKNIHKGVVVL